ncbi:MAG: TonB-dependent receptor domain-containing protein [Caulobacterales bacterium]|jgi:outer membrane receptor protein involved in Fe transport
MKSDGKTMFRSALFASVATAACLTVPGLAFGQQAAAKPAAKDVDVSEIVVTGSRIRRDTFNAPVPLAVVGSEQIRQSGDVILGDVLLQQPTIAAASNSQNTSSSLFNSGQARVDIRGLGPSRTLVLVDGRRHINGDASSPAVDLNLIPSLMIDRIEVVPGGVSAVYGSEAIAGVVNLIMKKEFQGLQVDAQVGTTQHGDGTAFITGIMAGGKFLDDRLNVLVGAEIAREEPIFQKDRADEGLFPGIRRNSAVGVVTQNVVPASRSSTSPFATFQLRPDSGVSLANPFGRPPTDVTTPGGVSLAGGASGYGVSGTLDVRDPSQLARLSLPCALRSVAPTCQDPSLFYSGVYNALRNRTERGSIRSYVDYRLTDHVKIFGEASFARADGYGYFQPAFSTTSGGGTLPVVLHGDNAYLNGPGATAAALRNLWTAPYVVPPGGTQPTGAGLALTSNVTVPAGKFWGEFGNRDVATKREVYRLVGGMEGDFNAFDRDIHWDWYAQYGHLKGDTTSFGVPNIQKVLFATDAVNVGGQIVCRATTSTDAATRAAAAGCVPWDLINGASREAVLYANGVATTTSVGKQTVVAGNLTADLFNLPAGPVGVAIGAEYRKEESSFVQDPLSATGALFFNAIGTRAGQFDVKEAYGEIRVPILKDLPFFKELSVEGAIRGSDYSTIGSTHQYRLAATWAPFEDIRFRASQATAVRAPNIVELFSPQSRNFTTSASDPCDSTVFAGASAAQQAARRVTCAAAIPGYDPTTFQSNIGGSRPSLSLLVGGNPGLGPETAKTYDLGVVIQPHWVPSLQLSFDFFRYNIDSEVGTIPLNSLFQNLCYDSTQPLATNPFCANIQRDPTGATTGTVGGVIQVVSTNQNVAKVKVEGIDASIAYSFDVADLLRGRDYGRIALRLDGTDMYQWALQGLPGQAYTQFANTINNATPRWKAVGTAEWMYNDLGVAWTTHFIGSMIVNNAFRPNQLSPYYTGNYFTHDLRVTYKLTDQVNLRGGVINITDEYPPYLPETFTGTGTGSSSFDNRGRFFFVGATLRY